MSQAIALLENDQTYDSSLSDGLKDEGYRVGTYAGAEKRSAERRDQERHHYPLRTAAKIFFFVGLATLFYMAAVIALALQSAIVEF